MTALRLLRRAPVLKLHKCSLCCSRRNSGASTRIALCCNCSQRHGAYADLELTDQIFLSGLVPPGSGFERITLNRPLDEGDHTVYVSLTQVDIDENGQQVIKNQVMHTMDFHVGE